MLVFFCVGESVSGVFVPCMVCLVGPMPQLSRFLHLFRILYLCCVVFYMLYVLYWHVGLEREYWHVGIGRAQTGSSDR